MNTNGLLDEEDDSWLLPSVKHVGVQAKKPFDLDEYLGNRKLPEGAAALSKKIAKYTKKREALESLVSLASVREESPNGLDIKTPSRSTTPEQEVIDPSCSNTTEEFCSFTSNPALTNCASTRTSTPRSDHEGELAELMLSPVMVDVMETPKNTKPSMSDEDEFFDASPVFSPEAMEKISMTASFSSIEALLGGPGEEEQEDGQSCIRNNMTKSLVKVDEEDCRFTPAQQMETPFIRNARSSSVSPRPTTTNKEPSVNTATPTVGTTNHNNSTINQFTPLSSRNGQTRRSLGPSSMLALATSQKLTPLRKSATSLQRISRNTGLTTPDGLSSQLKNTHISSPLDTSAKSRTVSPNPRSLIMTDLHPDANALQSMVQQQEEALRREVQQMADRKHSYHSEGSPHSSAGSLASSKSVDIGSLNKTVPPASKIPGPSRLPRRSAIPMPTKVQPNSRATTPSLSKFGGDGVDEFF